MDDLAPYAAVSTQPAVTRDLSVPVSADDAELLGDRVRHASVRGRTLRRLAVVATEWGVSPKESVRAEASRVGTREVARACMAILEGGHADGRFLYVLAGPASRPVVNGQAGGLGGYWPRVWALRGLRYAWDAAAEALVVEATTDESWRVREMAAKIIGGHLVDDGLDALGRLTEDPVPRVRAAASGARVALVRGGVRRNAR